MKILVKYVGHCDVCSSCVDRLIEYRRPGEWNENLGKFDEFPIKICRLCAYTPIGAIKKDEVKKLFGDSAQKNLSMQELGESISYVGNEILKAINELRNELKGDK